MAFATKSALHEVSVVNNKFWVGLLVEKPDNKSDAINVVDLVCDGIRDGCGIDDRWFSLSFVDWCINKNEPRIAIQLGQDSDFDAQACSKCGLILPLTMFAKNKSNKLGRGRVCESCRIKKK